MNVVVKVLGSLPDLHHVIRHIKQKDLIVDPDTKAVEGYFPAAWSMREIDNGKLSVCWVEYYGDANFFSVGKAISQFSSSYTTKKGDYFVVVGVCVVIKKALSHAQQCKVVYHPTKNNPAHASIVDIDMNESLKADFADEFNWLISNLSYLSWEASNSPHSPVLPGS